MRRLLLVTSVLCAIDTTQAFAQHEVSQQLLELEEADRNIFFTMLLHGSNNPTLFAAYLTAVRTQRRAAKATLTSCEAGYSAESKAL